MVFMNYPCISVCPDVWGSHRVVSRGTTRMSLNGLAQRLERLRSRPPVCAAAIAGSYLAAVCLVFAWEFPRISAGRADGSSLAGIFSILATLPSVVLVRLTLHNFGHKAPFTTLVLVSAAVQGAGIFLAAWALFSVLSRYRKPA